MHTTKIAVPERRTKSRAKKASANECKRVETSRTLMSLPPCAGLQRHTWLPLMASRPPQLRRRGSGCAATWVLLTMQVMRSMGVAARQRQRVVGPLLVLTQRHVRPRAARRGAPRGSRQPPIGSTTQSNPGGGTSNTHPLATSSGSGSHSSNHSSSSSSSSSHSTSSDRYRACPSVPPAEHLAAGSASEPS